MKNNTKAITFRIKKDLAAFQDLQTFITNYDSAVKVKYPFVQNINLRQKIYNFLESPRSSKAAMVNRDTKMQCVWYRNGFVTSLKYFFKI